MIAIALDEEEMVEKVQKRQEVTQKRVWVLELCQDR